MLIEGHGGNNLQRRTAIAEPSRQIINVERNLVRPGRNITIRGL